MAKQRYDFDTEMGAKRLATVAKANAILEEYSGAGFVLTLRQLYYQFVARGFLENKQQNYKALGETMNLGRLLGLVDWDHMEDRTRMLRGYTTYSSAGNAVEMLTYTYKIDMWKTQPHRVEIWVEKDALVDVVNKAASPERVNYFSCRGYTSQSEMREAGQRLLRYAAKGQVPVIIHLGDHDPSGIDMSRDIEDRINMFMEGEHFIFRRVALNMDQIEELNPPPNPAKVTDSRYASYQAKYGEESWELDALEPRAMTQLIQDTIDEYRDHDLWDVAVAKEQADIARLKTFAAKNG